MTGKVLVGNRKVLIGLVVLMLAACSAGTRSTPEPTPGPTPTLNEEIATYVQTYGGQASQYRVILTLDECENLGRLGLAQQEKMDRIDDPGDPEWRQALGYFSAILDRIEEIDCPENIPVP